MKPTSEKEISELPNSKLWIWGTSNEWGQLGLERENGGNQVQEEEPAKKKVTRKSKAPKETQDDLI